jgi:hypothetical protein
MTVLEPELVEQELELGLVVVVSVQQESAQLRLVVVVSVVT